METIDTQSPKNKLTARQQEIFEFIRERTQVSKMPPTVREIGDRFNISSTNGV
ncbi:MAG TPA: repressor LexA, partial [Fibrobacter sp.]|nr:repressor LexA [Fibrobacter sp.]